MKITRIILLLEGGGSRWGCRWYGSPHPRPLPPRAREIIELFSNHAIRKR